MGFFSYNLKPPTCLIFQRGIHEVFNQSDSNLSKINANCFVSAALQQIKLEVNEFGSIHSNDSLVHTAKIGSSDTTVEKFRADRPFIFLIVEKYSNIPLFAGSFRNPTYDLNLEKV